MGLQAIRPAGGMTVTGDQAAPQAASETTLAEVVRQWGDHYELRIPLDAPGYQALRRLLGRRDA